MVVVEKRITTCGPGDFSPCCFFTRCHPPKISTSGYDIFLGGGGCPTHRRHRYASAVVADPDIGIHVASFFAVDGAAMPFSLSIPRGGEGRGGG